MKRAALVSCICFCVLAVSADAQDFTGPTTGVRIPFNSHTGHPAILLAWRNTQKIFEAEVLVQNLTDAAHEIGVRLELIDEAGQILMQRPDAPEFSSLKLPARKFGGEDGAIVQIRGSREANLLIDLLDRQKQPYNIRASVYENIYENPQLIASSTRSMHTNSFVYPSSEIQRNFIVRNDSDIPKTYKFDIVRNGYDFGALSTCSRLAASRTFTLSPKQELPCYVRIAAKPNLEPDQAADVLVNWSAEGHGDVQATMESFEWFVTNDKRPPAINSINKTVLNDGSIQLEVLATSGVSGIEEASGVKVEYSLDGGTTFSNRVMTYLDGNFKDPTRFLATVGPFRPGSSVSLWVTVTSGAGLTTRIDLGQTRLAGL